MIIKGKTGFWIMVILFSLIAMLVVMNGENYGMEVVDDMKGTMGSIMKSEHAQGLRLANIIDGLFNASLSHHNETSGGHHSLPFYIASLDLGGSAIILLMLPLMVGAATIMVVLWI